MPQPSIHIVDTNSAVRAMVDNMQHLPTNPPPLYLDHEGIELSRNGTISHLQMLVHPRSKVYILDVHFLGTRAFNIPSSNGRTLKFVLESAAIPKVFFDCRNDSDDLHAHYDVQLKGVVDVQLMEVGCRSAKKPKDHDSLSSLEQLIGSHCDLTEMQQLASRFIGH